MTTQRIADPPPAPCRSPGHKPSTHIVLQPGTYEHECPKCGYKTIFVVPLVSL